MYTEGPDYMRGARLSRRGRTEYGKKIAPRKLLSLIGKASIAGVATRSFGTHSIRSGGASSASAHGVSDRLIGKHGRWSSDTSRDRYIKDTKKARLHVTEHLGF